MARRTEKRRRLTILLLALTCTGFAKLDYVEQLPLDTFAQMRETERYQLQQGEKFYLKGEYKIALAEYEKFLTLYEQSVAAPYAQLMWSHAQVNLRKLNTAIKDGFQSVVDYWPESHEAILAKYMTGYCYREMGEVKKAEKQFVALLEDHPKHLIVVRAKRNLIDLAQQQDDQEKRVKYLKDLTYETERSDATNGDTHWASRELARIRFYEGNFGEGLKALQTTYDDYTLVRLVHEDAHPPIYHLSRDEKTNARGLKLADEAIKYIDGLIPVDLTDDGDKKRARDYWYRKAGLYGSSGRKKNVRETYEQMIKIFGVDDEIMGSIAKWYKDEGERDKAKAIYGKYTDQIAGQGHIAYMFREEKKYDDSINIYRNLLTQDGDHAGKYQWAIAECYADSGRYKESIATYRQCDNYPEAYFRMAWCNRKLMLWKEALVLYNQAKSYEQSASEAQIQIGYTYEQAGEKEKAIKAFQQTCRAYPKSGNASRAHAHLQNVYKISVTLGGAKEE
ncbi:MAG: tetratricopeptide (TPR) repeat protein [Kiritimatiellia bacterium]|jgi:tetratricopeptide (TPR) repeat protein